MGGGPRGAAARVRGSGYVGGEGRLGFGEKGEGDGAGREEREMLERERGERDREALRLFFLDSR